MLKAAFEPSFLKGAEQLPLNMLMCSSTLRVFVLKPIKSEAI
ncbi:MAG: hypothetical protein R8M38_06955 [Mariprofundaceae bacterium]